MFKPLSITAFNWKVLIKSILCQILMLALVLALGFIIFGNLIGDIMRVVNENHILDLLSKMMNAIVGGEFDGEVFTEQLNQVLTSWREGIAQLKHPFGVMELTYVLFVVIVVLYRLLVSVTDVTVNYQLDEFMTSNATRPFTWYFFKKQGKTWQFALLQMVFTLPLDVLIVTGSLGFYLIFLLAFNWWTIIPVCIITILLYAARLSIFAFCLPSVVCSDLNTRDAFKRGLSKIVSSFWRVFWKTLIVVCLIVVVSVLSIMYISNTWVMTVVLTIPSFVLFFYLKCINVVEYFHAENRPFFYKRVDIEGTDRYNRKHRVAQDKK